MLALLLGYGASLLWRDLMRGAWETYIFSPVFRLSNTLWPMSLEEPIGLVLSWLLPAVLTYLAIRLSPRIKVRILRCTLQTPLLIVCACLVVLCLVAMQVDRPDRAEMDAAVHIENHGGDLYWGRRHVIGVSLSNPKGLPALLEHLKAFPKLMTLSLARTNVGDGDLARLRGLSRLRVLDLSGTRVTDAGLEHLKGLTQLQRLHLLCTKVTAEGVKKLQQALPNCEIHH